MTDEERVLGLLRARLDMGRREYGELDVHDGRDWEREALEELLDGVLYMAIMLVRMRDIGGRS